MIIDGFVLLVPLAVLPIVLLFVFVGCALQTEGIPGEDVTGTWTGGPPPSKSFSPGEDINPFLVPEGVTSLTAEAWGAGAGGGGPGGSGGGYSKATFDVLSGQTVFFHVGEGSPGALASLPTEKAGDSWVNADANSPPTSGQRGCIAGGAQGSGVDTAGTPGEGTIGIGDVNHRGGHGGVRDFGGGGGGGAGSTGDGGDASAEIAGKGGPGLWDGPPDGGDGGKGEGTLSAGDGSQPGGGGGGVWTSSTGGKGAHGQVKFTWAGNV